MKKKSNGYEARSDKVIQVIVMFMLVFASLTPLTVSAGAVTSTKETTAPTPTPTVQAPKLPSLDQRLPEPAVSWNS